MLVKKPSILVATYSSLHSLPFGYGSSTSSPDGIRQRRNGYATVAGDPSDHHEPQVKDAQPEYVWPKPPKGQNCPTPYQIFAMKHNAEYSKIRFYELVKLYHPDLSNGNSKQISHHVRTERYRLLVAAHTILSDPIKRNAYDRFGAGWNGRAELGSDTAWRRPSPHHPPGPFSHSWSDPNNPIWANATWEDWERFYARRDRAQNPDASHPTPQSPVYLQNSYFLALILLLAIVGSSANYKRSQDAGLYFVEQRDIVHDKAAKELRRVRQEMSGMNGRDERIQWFLRQREATMGTMASSDVEALKDRRAHRLLPDQEVCGSEGVSGKNP